MSLSRTLAEKSVQAAVASIEIYNKPDFRYREEAFSLLMANAWELLLKAKWLIDHDENMECLYVVEATGGYKSNRSGNPITHDAIYLAKKLSQDKTSHLERGCYYNLLVLIEIRDNAAHFLNKDLNFGRRVQEVGIASLSNYLQLATEWFQLDLTRYNFFLMPLSFYHGFETVNSLPLSTYSSHGQKLIEYIDYLEAKSRYQETDGSVQHMTLRIETKLSKTSKSEAAAAFKWTNDPSAPAMQLREEDVLKNYPLTYRKLVDALRNRYVTFLENRAFHKIRKEIETENKFSIIRLLDPSNPRSSKQRFYNPNVFAEFDKHYKIKGD